MRLIGKKRYACSEHDHQPIYHVGTIVSMSGSAEVPSLVEDHLLVIPGQSAPRHPTWHYRVGSTHSEPGAGILREYPAAMCQLLVEGAARFHVKKHWPHDK
jgi:hypothetical protein